MTGRQQWDAYEVDLNEADLRARYDRLKARLADFKAMGAPPPKELTERLEVLRRRLYGLNED